jgi:hypothetical protein
LGALCSEGGALFPLASELLFPAWLLLLELLLCPALRSPSGEEVCWSGLFL